MSIAPPQMRIPSLTDYQAAVDRATQEFERARSRQGFADRVADEFRAGLQRAQAVLEAAPADCEVLRQRLQLMLAPAVQGLLDVVQDEQERVISAESQLAQAHERLRRAEQAATPRLRK
jgi:hypothetical protein